MNSYLFKAVGGIVGTGAAMLDNLMLPWILERPGLAGRTVDHSRIRILNRSLIIIFPIVCLAMGFWLGR